MTSETIDIASKEMWEKAKTIYLATLQSANEKSQVDRYLSMITSVTSKNGNFTIYTANTYAADYLKDNYSDRLRKCLELVSNGLEINLNLILRILDPKHHFKEFHQVARLVECPNERIDDLNALGTLQIRGKQVLVVYATLVFNDSDDPLGKPFLPRNGWCRRDCRCRSCLRPCWWFRGHTFLVSLLRRLAPAHIQRRILHLLQRLDRDPFSGFVVGKGEIHGIVGRVNAEELVLDPLPVLDGQLEQFADFLLGRLARREEYLHQPGEGLLHPVSVTRGDRTRQGVVVLVLAREV